MRVLFVMRHPGFLRNFEAVVRELASRRHEVLIAIEDPDKQRATYQPVIEALTADAVARFVAAPKRSRDAAAVGTTQVRLALDYLRYLRPEYTDKDKLRERAALTLPAPLRRLLEQPRVAAASPRPLRALERAAPVRREVPSFLAETRPDLLMVTPLVELGAPQTDYVRAARAAGIPTCLAVASWDNLTVKGSLRAWPDLVAVWNGAQVREAVELHAVPAAPPPPPPPPPHH